MRWQMGVRAGFGTAMGICGAVAATGGAFAQEEAIETQKVPALSVTATKLPMPAFDVPGQTSVINRERVTLEAPSTLDDLVSDVPGVTFSGGPRRTGEEPSIRGFTGSDVILTIDGVRQNFDSGHDGRIFLDPFFLNEVEVVKGSSSALYGSGGTGGVIAFRTVEADDLLADDAQLGVQVGTGFAAGSDEVLLRTLGAAKPTDWLDLVAGIVTRNAHDIQLGGDGEQPARDQILSGLFKGGLDLGAGHAIEASWAHFANDAFEPGNGQAAVSGTNPLNAKDIESDTYRLAYEFDGESPWFDLEATLFQTQTQVDEIPASGSSAGQLFERSLDTVGFTASNTSRVDLWGSDLALTYGGDIYEDSADGSANGGPRGGVVEGEQRHGGVFAQAAWTLYDLFGWEGAELALIPGLRYDMFESTASGTDQSDEALSPKFAARFSPVGWFMTYASFGEAFRAPTLDELYPSGTHFSIGIGTNSFVPNPDLKPQRTDTAEIGAGVQFTDLLAEEDSFQFKGGYYVIEGEDFIDLHVIQPEPPACIPFVNCNGTTQAVNRDTADLFGWELEGVYEISWLRVALGATAMEAKGTGQNATTLATETVRLGVEQPDTLTLHTLFKFDDIGTRLGWRVTAADAYDEGTETSDHRDGYVVHDVYARLTPSMWWGGALEGLSIGFGARNIFDKRYERVASESLEAGQDVWADLGYRVSW